LHVVNRHFQAAIDAAMIKVVTKPANLKRLTATFVLARVDTCIKTLNDLIVAFEE